MKYFENHYKNEKWKKDFSFIDEEGTSFVDNYYTKAYLRHLFVAGEMLAAMIASIHNLRFYQKLMAGLRQAIEQKNLDKFEAEFYSGYTT